MTTVKYMTEAGVHSIISELGGEGVSFAEIVNNYPEVLGDKKLIQDTEYLPNATIVYWIGLKSEFIQSLLRLRDNNIIRFTPCDFLVYLADGKLLKLPVLTKIDKRMKGDWWLPVTLEIV